jgi:hypothetical protein
LADLCVVTRAGEVGCELVALASQGVDLRLQEGRLTLRRLVLKTSERTRKRTDDKYR